ncbi:PREDICTED: transcription factor GTE3, chloroplastic-like [Nicotiana attenuata]|uniref:transcription factor GTE3, chloroplastic-like n=1 Tax=Nicotiana attenuata TaxID=49451 RepID=UPI000905774D|nr:PREDICTED: transcription factor GTE3, chloroplastic-like [Nicotiana attenuata]
MGLMQVLSEEKKDKSEDCSDQSKQASNFNNVSENKFTHINIEKETENDKLAESNLSGNYDQTLELIGENSKNKNNNKNLSGKKREFTLASNDDIIEGDKAKSSTIMKIKCQTILRKLLKHHFGWLKRDEYKTPEEFADDVRLTSNNAIIYNPKGSDIYTMAQVLLGKFEEMFEPVYAQYLAQPEVFLMSNNELSQPLPIAKRLEELEEKHDGLVNEVKRLKASCDELLQEKLS